MIVTTIEDSEKNMVSLLDNYNLKNIKGENVQTLDLKIRDAINRIRKLTPSHISYNIIELVLNGISTA